MRFEKWQGCGNDFLVVERSEVRDGLSAERVRALCDRRSGVGADGILVVGEPNGRRWPVEIRNADGSVAESCGNGSRCVARYLLERHGGDECELATEGGTVRARRSADGIAVQIPTPRLGVAVRVDTAHQATRVDVGNPHLVVFVEDPAGLPLDALARATRAAGGDANVEAVAVRSRDTIDLRVDERGVGETLACGTGACAAVAAAAAGGLVDDVVSVRFPGGRLAVRVGRERYELSGPAERVFEGTA